MNKLSLSGFIFLMANLAPLNAAEITTCIIDTSIKTNQVFYYFPITTTELRCGHIKNNTPVTLAQLYENNWRLIQVVSPIRVDQGNAGVAYTPPVLYLERTKLPAISQQKPTSSESSYSSDDTTSETASEGTSQSKSGGIFGWLKGNSGQETESE